MIVKNHPIKLKNTSSDDIRRINPKHKINVINTENIENTKKVTDINTISPIYLK